ncbi:metal ABC transporter substrate-binding protein, partial [Streptomyces sioyaensis]|uniref:metal ABC transporter substrate-binding protein n=1 Tax=Streptomyces sioyaensis TaxID=67364 RepID=UPI0033F32ABE
MGAVLALVCGCGSSAVAATPGSSRSDTPSTVVPVVASTNVYGDIARQVGGDHVKVVSIINDSAQDPHSYEASTQNRLALSEAKVVVENGGGYDDFIDRMLDGTKNSSPTVINAVQVSGRAAQEGTDLNEHVWYDFSAMGKLADRIAAALAKASPGAAAVFLQHAKSFKDRLTALEG